MSKVTNVRNETANNATNGSKPIHYINYYDRDSGIDLGYRTIDKLPQVDIDIAQKSPEACDKRFGNAYERAVYRQAGVTTPKSVNRSLADF